MPHLNGRRFEGGVDEGLLAGGAQHCAGHDAVHFSLGWALGTFARTARAAANDARRLASASVVESAVPAISLPNIFDEAPFTIEPCL